MDFIAVKAHEMSHAQLFCPMYFSADLLTSQSLPSLYCCMVSFHPRYRIYPFSSPFLQLVKVPLNSNLSLQHIRTLSPTRHSLLIHNKISLLILLRMCSLLLSRSLIKPLSSIGPSVSPWGMPWVYSHQLDFVSPITILCPQQSSKLFCLPYHPLVQPTLIWLQGYYGRLC